MSSGQPLTIIDNKGNFGQEFRDPKIAQCFALAETVKMLNQKFWTQNILCLTNGSFVKPSQVAFLSARISSQRSVPEGDSPLEQTLRLTTSSPRITALRTTVITKIRHYLRTLDSCPALSLLKKILKINKEFLGIIWHQNPPLQRIIVQNNIFCVNLFQASLNLQKKFSEFTNLAYLNCNAQQK